MLRRVTRLVASGASDLGQILAGIEDQITLIFDVDGTVARQGAAPAERARAVEAAIASFEGYPCVRSAIPLTNSAEQGIPRVISRGNKPWTTRRRLGLSRDDRTVVIGDQVLTDGLLAWRLGAIFVHLAVDTNDEPPAQVRLRKRGRWLEPIIFKDAPG